MDSKQVTWTQSGHEVTVEVFAGKFVLTMDDTYKAESSVIVTPNLKDRAMYAQRGAYGNIGKVVIYNERAQELEAIRAEIKASDPLTEFRHLETALFAAEESVRTWQDRNANPATEYQRLHEARAAFDAWCEANRELYDAEQARRGAAQQTRRNSLNVDMWM